MNILGLISQLIGIKTLRLTLEMAMFPKCLQRSVHLAILWATKLRSLPTFGLHVKNKRNIVEF